MTAQRELIKQWNAMSYVDKIVSYEMAYQQRSFEKKMSEKDIIIAEQDRIIAKLEHLIAEQDRINSELKRLNTEQDSNDLELKRLDAEQDFIDSEKKQLYIEIKKVRQRYRK